MDVRRTWPASQLESGSDEKAGANSMRGPRRPSSARTSPMSAGPAYRHDLPRTASRLNPQTHNVAVERSDAETGFTPGPVQFCHPWAPPPGTKSDRVGAPEIAWESAGFDSLTA